MVAECPNHPKDHSPNQCPGLGRVLCRGCGKPVNTHKVGEQCPEIGGRMPVGSAASDSRIMEDR